MAKRKPKPKPASHDMWSVFRDTDVGTFVHSCFLRESQATRLADLLNEIEADRIEALGGDRSKGQGDFYTAKQQS